MARLPYSLLLACLLVLLASPNPTSALSHAVGRPDAVPRHLQHAHLADSKKRMVKVRQLLREGAKGAGVTTGDTTGDTNDPGASSSTSAAATTTTAAAATTTTAARTTTTTTTQASQSVATTTTDAAQSALSSSADSSSAAVSTTSASSTTTSAAQSPTLNLVTQSTPSSTPISSASQSLSVATAQVTVDLPTQSAEADTSTSANTFGRNTIIAIVVIASCVGGAAAIWTLIRKWKLGPSAKFEERMAPIEWSPDMGSTAGAGIPGADREKTYGATEKHSRSGSHGSFHSSDAEHNNLGRNVTGNGNMFADQHPTSYAPEAHDFTAGPAHYGNTGYDAYGNPAATYVDLQRTNSNGSNHSDKGGLQHSQSANHGAAGAAPYAYDNNAYGGAAYGHDAYAQDAYAGYDAYGQHYPAQQGQYGAQQGQYGARY